MPKLSEHDHPPGATNTPQDHSPARTAVTTVEKGWYPLRENAPVLASKRTKQYADDPFSQQASSACEMDMKHGSAAQGKYQHLSEMPEEKRSPGRICYLGQ